MYVIYVYSIYVRHDICSDMGYVCSLCMYSMCVSQCICSSMYVRCGVGLKGHGESVAEEKPDI